MKRKMGFIRWMSILIWLSWSLTLPVSAQSLRQTFEDTFENNANRWDLGSFDGGEFTIVNGELSLTSTTPGGAVALQVPSDTPFESFMLNLDMRTEASGFYSYDIWFNSAADFSSALVMRIFPQTREMGIYVRRNDTFVSGDSLEVRAIQRSGVNQIGLNLIRDEVVIITINGEQLSPIPLNGVTNDLEGGAIFIGVSSYEGETSPVRGYFDNLSIQHIEFREQFNDNGNGWRLGMTESGTAEILGGELIITATQANAYKPVRLPSLLGFDQYMFTFSATAPENSSAIYSVWLRADELTLNGLQFSVSLSRQAVACSNRQEGVYQSGGWIDAPMLNEQGENTFLIRLSVVAALVEINGVLLPVACRLDATDSYGSSIFFAVEGSPDGPVSVRFDSILVATP